MRWLDTRWLLAALAVVTSGCLLPQPDTPWVPPGRDGQVKTGEQNSGAIGAAAPQIAPVAKAQLSGRVEGLAASALSFIDAATNAQVLSLPLGADGAFAVALPAGRYWLELHVGSDLKRVGTAIALAPGENRELRLKVTGERVTIEEEAALVPASPEPTPSPGSTP